MEQRPLQSEKSGSLGSIKNGGLPAEGFKGHVATDGLLPGIAGKCGASVWSIVHARDVRLI